METYYVYKIIKTGKVGATKNIVSRLKEQGYSFPFKDDEVQILGTFVNAAEASFFERAVQEREGVVDSANTYLSRAEQVVNTTPNKERTYKVHHGTITIYDGEVNFKTIVINETVYAINKPAEDWIKNNLKKSQYGADKPYIYIEAFVNWFNTITEEEEEFQRAFDRLNNTSNVFDQIRDWAKERGIYDKGDTQTQYVKLMEEAGELAQGLLKNKQSEITDAIGDMVVVLTNLAHLQGVSIEYCINSAYTVISNRTGKMVNGTFVKDE